MRLVNTPPILPGFKLSFGISVFWLSLMVILPLAMLFITVLQLNWLEFWDIVTNKRVLSALRVSFFASFFAILVNMVFGLLLAFVLVRYDFFGKSIMNGLIDLPFALPTAVAGVALATLYAENGWVGKIFAANGFIGQWLGGLKIAYTPLGIWLALIFVSMPFIVRSVQPVLEQMDTELEEAAQVLGSGFLTTFRRVIFPGILPALLTGSGMGFARATGEFGSVIFIAGNIPFVSEIAPLLIIDKLDQFDKVGASAIALIMLFISFLILLVMNLLQWYFSRYLGNQR